MKFPYKIHLAKSAESAFYAAHHTTKDPKPEIERLIVDFTLQAIEELRKEVGAYGTNTHTYACVECFAIELRRELGK